MVPECYEELDRRGFASSQIACGARSTPAREERRGGEDYRKMGGKKTE
jgi:hypothetical protein